MEDVLEKPPVAGTPDLPPFLRKRGGGRRRWIIIPSLWHAEQQVKLVSQENNWITTCYVWMVRWDLETGEMEFASIYHRKYRKWLETYETETGIPPHISFGGAIEAGERDETFYPRWVEHAKEMFV